MSEEKLYYLFEKDDYDQVSKNFRLSEFACRCSKEHEHKISKELVDTLQKLRDELGEPLEITSGYRDPEHNKAIGGAPKSQHVLGNAVDLKCSNMDKLYELCEKYFMAVGDGRKIGFIHVDLRKNKQRRWGY
jgi:uncharacterized protein YcbK (DUF882 family)